MLKLKLKMKQKLKNKFPVSSLMLVLALVLSSFTSITLQAQDRVTGKVTGQDGVPLPGVNVLQKGTSKGAVTDFDGKFTLLLGSGSKTLLFSYIGYQTKEVALGAENDVTVILQEDVESLDEVVVIGYVPVKREKITSPVETIKADAIEQATPVEALGAIQGQLSGVQIVSNNRPGSGFDVQIRGVATFGSTAPLYVVDGQQLDDIDNIDPSDILSLEVLKDAASAAIYGSRGGNGVVLITTKSGKAGKTSVTITSNTGINSLVGSLPRLTTRQRVEYDEILAEIQATNNPNPNRATRDRFTQLNRNSTNLQDVVTRSALRNQINVAIASGSEKTKLYWNSGFINEDGLIINSNYKRINTRIKLDVEASKKFKFGTNVNLTFEDFSGPNEFNVLRQLIERPENFPVFEPDGSPTPTIRQRQNPVGQALLRTNETDVYRGQVYNYAQFQITPKLSIKSTLGINLRFDQQFQFTPSEVDRLPENEIIQGDERTRLRYDIQQENFLNYKNKWGQHSFGAFVGVQSQTFRRNTFRIRSRFASETVRTFNNALLENVNLDGTFNTNNKLFSTFGGFNYDYANKYLISGTIRRDGSSRFGINNRFGYFPSASAGWRISNEEFLKGNALVKNVLLRLSYGIVGNQNIGDFEARTTLQPGAFFNGANGVAPDRPGNGDLRWEQSEAFNVGLDLSFFKGKRLNIVADVWQKNTRDLLNERPLPLESGFENIRSNIGSVTNRGIDLKISGAIIKTKDFSWNSSFNIGFLENEITELFEGRDIIVGLGNPGGVQIPTYRLKEGESIGDFHGHRNLGIFRFDESNAYTPDGSERLNLVFDAQGEIARGEDGRPLYTRQDGSAFVGTPGKLSVGGVESQGGDIIWENRRDEDGNYDLSIDENDATILGNGFADIFGGFSHVFKYKNMSLNLLFDYSFGQDIYRAYDADRDSGDGSESPSPERFLNPWLNPGDVSLYPRFGQNPQNTPGTGIDSFYVSDASFIKWRYIRFNYNLPKTLLANLKFVNSASFNIGINNVLTWTNYEGFNPELGTRGDALRPGFDSLRYPNDREVLVGFKVKF